MFETFATYVGKKKGPNRFWHVDESAIAEAETRLGMKFPAALRAFFSKVGSGFWAKGTADSAWDRSLVNRIPSPRQIADLYCNKDDPWRPNEGFGEGAIPFFDVGENTYFVVIPKMKSSGAVYWPDGKQVVTDSLDEFFSELEMHAGFYRQS